MKDSKSILDMKKEATGQNRRDSNGNDASKSAGGYSLYTLILVSLFAFALGQYAQFMQ